MENAHAVTLLKPIFTYVELTAVLGGECWWLRVILFAENTREKVVLEFNNKILDECEGWKR